MVLGGDGSILRGAEPACPHGTPVLGVNLGHVGFLAEAEREDLERTVGVVVERSYVVEERMTLDVEVRANGALVTRTWALNEASVEKAARADARDHARRGRAAAVALGLRTASCARLRPAPRRTRSAGGPVVWPEVEAILVVPLSAHALFARPMVVGPSSRLGIELVPGYDGRGVLWCDGRRTIELPRAARIDVRRGDKPVRLARCTRRRSPTGWWRSSTCRSWAGGRGRPQERQRQERTDQLMLTEIRITGLGVIEDATLDLDPGFTAVTGETGAGKTMVVTGVGMLLGVRADSGLVRHGTKRARVEAAPPGCRRRWSHRPRSGAATSTTTSC